MKSKKKIASDVFVELSQRGYEVARFETEFLIGIFTSHSKVWARDLNEFRAIVANFDENGIKYNLCVSERRYYEMFNPLNFIENE